MHCSTLHLITSWTNKGWRWQWFLSPSLSFNLMIVPFLGKDLSWGFWKEERAPSSPWDKSQKTGGHRVRTCPKCSARHVTTQESSAFTAQACCLLKPRTKASEAHPPPLPPQHMQTQALLLHQPWAPHHFLSFKAPHQRQLPQMSWTLPYLLNSFLQIRVTEALLSWVWQQQSWLNTP